MSTVPPVPLSAAVAEDGAGAWRGAYRSHPGGYDEMAGPVGTRPAYSELWPALMAMGPAGLAGRWAVGQRLLRDNGVTYHAPGHGDLSERAWGLDPVPRIIPAGEWATLAANLVQRARLIEALFLDFYGSQRLLEDGAVPPSLVLNHPGFLHPCHGLPVPIGSRAEPRPLGLIAFDLARGPDGNWWVLTDRTQGPAGAGYALENRQAVARTLPESIAQIRAQPLGGFFSEWRDGLRALSPRPADQPRVVILSPGPTSPTYFEQAFLARYLGFNLVQGADLTVRDQVVYLKTVGGLRRVDVVVRRVDDSYCDPLELRGESLLGVAGLLQAVRAGSVAVSNAPGSGVLATPALTPFYPGLCRRLLGEELRLNSVATWWCGQADALQHVEQNLESLVLKPSFPGARSLGPDGQPVHIVFGDRLTQVDRAELIGQIRERPGAWTAQENVNLSTVPTLDGDRLRPRHVVLRAFVAASATAPGGFVVMPGGLTRVSSSDDSRLTAMQIGGASKDTWVQADAVRARGTVGTDPGAASAASAASAVAARPAPTRAAAGPTGDFDLPSRAADNLFWLGRYVERGETMARLLRALAVRLQEQASGVGGGGAGVAILTDALVAVTYGDDPPEGAGDEPPGSWLRAALVAPAVPGGLSDCLGRARQLAAMLRDRLSPDIGRVLGGLAPPEAAGEPEAVEQALDAMVLTLSAFAGLTAESVLRSQEYRFLDLGRRLERAHATAVLLGVVVKSGRRDRAAQLEAVLESIATAMTYRLRYLTTPALAPTLDLVLRDETNPRGVAFQLRAVLEHLAEMPRSDTGEVTPEEIKARYLLKRMRDADPEDLAGTPGNPPTRLGIVATEIAADVEALAARLSQRYLEHSLPLTELRVPGIGPLERGRPTDRVGGHGPEDPSDPAEQR